MLSLLLSSLSQRCGSSPPSLSSISRSRDWTDGSIPFPFDKGSNGVLADRSLCGTKATLIGMPNFSAEACTTQQNLLWSQQHQQVCLFFSLLSDFCPVFAKLSSPSCFLLFHTFRHILQELYFSPPSLLSGCNASPITRFYQEMTWLMRWPNKVRCFSNLQSHVIPVFLPLASTNIFNRTGGVQSHLNYLTHRYPLRNLCFLVTLPVPSLSSSFQRKQPSVNLLPLKHWQN